MKKETKIASVALGATLLSMLCLYLIAFNNRVTNPIAIAVVAVVAVVAAAVVVAAAAAAGVTTATGAVGGGAAAAVVAATAAGAAAAVVVVAAAAGAVAAGIVVVCWDKNKKELSFVPAIFLCLVFILPFVIGIIPLSKHHNQNQLERDERITEMLKIKILEDGIEVLLPSKYASKNPYLKNVFYLGWEEGKKREWKETAIICREGDNIWYKAKLSFPENKTNNTKLVLFFDHAWEDFQITKTVPLSSL